MSARLYDANALIYYYRDERIGERIEDLRNHRASGPHFVTDWALLEIHAVLARLVRQATLSEAECAAVFKRVLYDVSETHGWLRIQPVRRSFLPSGRRLIEDYGLRQRLALSAADCLHLLTALELQGRFPGLRLVTADTALANIASLADVPVDLLEASV